MIKEIDKKLSLIEREKNLIKSYDKNSDIIVEFKNELIKITRTISENNKHFIINFILKENGIFKEKELLVVKNNKVIYKENIKNKSPIEIRKSLSKSESPFYFEDSISQFSFSRKMKNKTTGFLLIEKEIKFLDPKILTGVIIGSSYAASEEMIADRLLFFLRYGWIDYVQYLIKEILKSTPSKATLKAISTSKSAIKITERIKTLQKNYKSFSYSFVPLEDIKLNEK